MEKGSNCCVVSTAWFLGENGEWFCAYISPNAHALKVIIVPLFHYTNPHLYEYACRVDKKKKERGFIFNAWNLMLDIYNGSFSEF